MRLMTWRATSVSPCRFGGAGALDTRHAVGVGVRALGGGQRAGELLPGVTLRLEAGAYTRPIFSST
jgi:hypothetical protein